MVKRINISLDEDALQKIDDFCDSRHMTRSALIQLSCGQYIESQEKIPNLLNQLKELKKLAPESWFDGIDKVEQEVLKVQM